MQMAQGDSRQDHHKVITVFYVLRHYGFCPGQPRWAGTRRNIHPLTASLRQPFIFKWPLIHWRRLW